MKLTSICCQYFILSASALFSFVPHPSLGQSIENPLYMGKASTGEDLWFYGGRAQCGDLPRADKCWRNPMIVYTLGNERFTTILDCSKKIFALAMSDTTGRKYRNVAPTSKATSRMINMACESAARQL